jgi:hypothetical protein
MSSGRKVPVKEHLRNQRFSEWYVDRFGKNFMQKYPTFTVTVHTRVKRKLFFRGIKEAEHKIRVYNNQVPLDIQQPFTFTVKEKQYEVVVDWLIRNEDPQESNAIRFVLQMFKGKRIKIRGFTSPVFANEGFVNRNRVIEFFSSRGFQRGSDKMFFRDN